MKLLSFIYGYVIILHNLAKLCPTQFIEDGGDAQNKFVVCSQV